MMTDGVFFARAELLFEATERGFRNLLSDREQRDQTLAIASAHLAQAMRLYTEVGGPALSASMCYAAADQEATRAVPAEATR